MTGALPAVAVGVATALLLAGDRPEQRLDVLRAGAGPASSGRRAAPPGGGDHGTFPPRLVAAACGLAGLALVVLVGGVPGLVLGGASALLGPRALRLLPADDREQAAVAADLPLALDLLAACLAGGAAPHAALVAVAAAVPGACGARLERVAAALALGTPPAQAWQALSGRDLASGPALGSAGHRTGPAVGSGATPGPGPAAGSGGDLAAVAARAMTRAAEGGAPVAATVQQVVADVRRTAAARAAQRAKRAGVLAVAPLGACFLPAFLLLGVVPAVLGLAGPLLSGS